MPIVRTAVLLSAFPAGKLLKSLALRDAPWYTDYIFSPSHGQAAYWAQQCNNDIILEGETFDWWVDETLTPDLSLRVRILNDAIRAMEDHREGDFRKFDL